MARRLDRLRPGQDAVTHYLKEYGDRLHTGVVRDGYSLGWIVDAMEWISYDEHLADQLVDRRYYPQAFIAEHPLSGRPVFGRCRKIKHELGVNQVGGHLRFEAASVHALAKTLKACI